MEEATMNIPEPHLDVICSATSHPTKVCTVGIFGLWQGQVVLLTSGRVHLEGSRSGRIPSRVMGLAGDTPVPGMVGEPASDEYPAATRETTKLPCSLCGLDVSLREETVQETIGPLIDRGVTRLELADLASIISK
jgi:hypothetical protein